MAEAAGGRGRADPRSWLGGRLPGAAPRRLQVAAYALAWTQANAEALDGTGPLWAALGDSASQGVGASAYDRGWVGQLHQRLRVDDGAWRVVNLSVSGARTIDVIRDQVPRLAELPAPALVTCAVGGNDLVRTRWRAFEPALRRLLAALPPGTVVATMPRGVNERRARLANDLIVAEAPAHGLRVADLWGRTGPPWAGKFSADHFHPADAGYTDWAAAFAAALVAEQGDESLS